MLKKTITYEDYNGASRTEDFYFNMNKSEVIKFLTTSGDYTLDKVMDRLTKERNGKEIMRIFEEILKISYGEKSLDGRKFEKSDKIWNDFYQTEAYSELFTELVTDAAKAADFFNGIIPKQLADEVNKIMDQYPDGIPDELKDYQIARAQPVVLPGV